MTSQNHTDLKIHLQSFQSSDDWTADQHATALTSHLTTGPKEIKFNQRDIDVPWSSATVRRVLRKKKQSI